MDDEQIRYIYDASGTKLQKQIYVNNTLTSITSYVGAFLYEKSSSSGSEQLQCFSHAEGYVEKVDQVYYQYFYQYKDHLGNVRLNYAKGPDSLMIKEENNYYPFGLKHNGYNNTITGSDHKYGYGNKEEQDELGLEWIDITARNYDPAIGRWMNIDPLADDIDNYEFSPYNYAINNPIFFIDPDGMKWKDPKEVEELKINVQNKRDALSQKNFDLIIAYFENGDFNDEAFENLSEATDKNSLRIMELDQTLEYIDVLGKDEDYFYDLTSGNSDSSHVKSSDGRNVSIEGPDDALKIHEITHVGIERSAGRKLAFNDSWKMVFPNIHDSFVQEVSAYRSQWAYENQSNNLISSDGSISTRGDTSKYSFGRHIKLLSINLSAKKLRRNEKKNPHIYSSYRILIDNVGHDFKLANQILTDINLRN
ncbi:hypothetical protein BST91_07150 [Nonlabens tegetincola]|nr:hypothetical protein BST91_07150 [Nonlabens tegetincola]